MLTSTPLLFSAATHARVTRLLALALLWGAAAAGLAVDVPRNFTVVSGNAVTGAVALTKTGAGTLSLIGSSGNTFSGDITVDVDAGTNKIGGNIYGVGTMRMGLTLPGLTAANTITVRRGGTFYIEDNVSTYFGYVADRLGTAGNRPKVSLAGGTLTLNGANYGVPMTQTLGDLLLASGPSVVNVTLNTAGTPQLVFAGLVPSRGAFVSFTGTLLGSGTADARILFTAPPPAVGGGGAAGSRTMSIVPGARAGNDLAWYGDYGIRALLASEYHEVGGVNDINAAGATANVKLAGTTSPFAPLSAPRTNNSLTITAAVAATWPMSNTLTLASGQLLSVPANTLLISSGALTAGSGSNTDLDITILGAGPTTLGANINDNGAGAITLVKNGVGTLVLSNATDNTYSGGTVVNEGILMTGPLTNRLYLGTGSVRVDNAILTMGAAGAAGFGAAGQAAYTAVNGGQINLANAAYTNAGDRFDIRAGSVVAGSATATLTNGLNSLTRVGSLAGISGGQAVLAAGSILVFGGTLTNGLGTGLQALAGGGGTAGDLYFGLGANPPANSTITVGPGTPWLGLTTDRTARNFLSGTITANGDFNLQGFAPPGVAPVLLTMGSAGPVAIATPNGSVNVNILGPVTWTTASSALGSGGNNVTFVVNPGATFTLSPTNALAAGAGSAVSLVVQDGGTLALGVPNALNAAATVQAGGRFNASLTGLAGSGALAFDNGSVLDITAALGFSGTQAAAAAVSPGAVVRLDAAGIGSAFEPLDAYLAGASPIYEVYGAANWFTNPAVANTAILTLNADGAGAGGMLVNDAASRSIAAAPNGVIVIGPNGGTIAATTNTTLTLPQAIALGANALTIGATNQIDRLLLPKHGTVTLSAALGYNTALSGSSITVIPCAALINGANAIPDAADLVVNGLFALGGAETIGSLAGAGMVNLGANALTVGRNNNGPKVFSGELKGTGAFTKTGTNRLDLTRAAGVTPYTGAVTVNGGILALSGEGTLLSTAYTLIGDGALLLDNTDADHNNRLIGTAGLAFQGGTFRFAGHDDEDSGESLGAASFIAGAATIDVINGADASAVLSFSAAAPGTGTVNFTASGGTLGAAGNNPRVFFANLAAGLVGYATVGGAPAYYDTTNGIRAYTTAESWEFDGHAAQTASNTVYTAARPHGGSAPYDDLNTARTVNSLWISSPGADRFIDLFTNNLAITSGRIILSGTDDFEIKRNGATGTLANTVPAAALFFGVDDAGATLTISAPIANTTGPVVKHGAGTLVLNATNTFTTGGLLVNAGAVKYGASGRLADSAPVTVWGSGVLDLNGANDTVGAVTVKSGSIVNPAGGGTYLVASLTLGGGPGGSATAADSGTGTNALNGNVAFDASNDPGPAVIAGNLALNGATRTFTVGNSLSTNAAVDLHVSAVISGTNGIVKAGAGVLQLSGNNTFDGTTTNAAGTLRITRTGALGPGINPRPAVIASGATLALDGSGGPISLGTNLPLVLAGVGDPLLVPVSGVLANLAGTNTLAGAITLATPAPRIASLKAGDQLVLSGAVGGAFGLTVDGAGDTELGGALAAAVTTLTMNGAGTLTLSGAGANAHTGLTIVNGGKLVLNKSGSVQAIAAAGVTVANGGMLQYAAGTTNADLMGAGAVTLAVAGCLDFNGASDAIGAVTIAAAGATADTTPIRNTAGGGNLTLGALAITPAAGYLSRIDTGTGTNTLGGNVTFTASGTGRARISGNLALGGATRTFTVGLGTPPATGYELEIDAAISGGAGFGLSKAGTGALRLSGTNSYDGPTTVSGGTLRLAHAQALGAPSAGRTNAVAAASSLALDGVGIADPDNRFTLSLNGAGDTRVGPLSGALVSLAGNNAVPCAIVMAAAGQVASLTPGDKLTLTNAIGVAAALTVDGAGDTEFSGAVVGTGAVALVKNGLGTLTLSGAGANTFSGTTTVNTNKLVLNKAGQASAIAGGAITINASGVVEYAAGTLNTNQVGTAAVTINGAGYLDFNGASDTIGAVTIAAAGATADTTPIRNTAGGGNLTVGALAVTPAAGCLSRIDTGSGTNTLGGNVTFTASGTGQARISGNLALGGATRTFTVGAGNAAWYDMDIDAVISGAAGFGLTKAGTGVLRLSRANTYDGPAAVSAGTLRITDAQALGAPGSGRTNTIAAASSLALDGVSISDPDNRFTLSLAGTGNTLLGPVSGALVSLAGTNTVPCAIVLAAASQVASLKAGDTLTLTNTIGGAFGLTVDGAGDTVLSGALAAAVTALAKNGAGTLTLSASNACAGAVTVSQGALVLNGAGALAGTGAAALTLNTGGALVLDNRADNNTNRLTGAAPGVTFNGGTFVFLGRDAAASSEGLGAATIAAGASTIGVTNGAGAGSRATVTFTSLARAAGATVNFTYGGEGTLGAGLADEPRVMITNLAAGLITGATVNGTSPAEYVVTNGVRALAPSAEFDGAADQAGLHTKYTAARTTESDTLTASRSVSTLTISSPGTGKFISLGGDGTAYALTVSGGTILLAGPDSFEIRREGTATGTLSGTHPNIFVSDPGATLTISAPVAGTNALTKAGPGTLALSGTNTYTGITRINAGTLRVASLADGGTPCNLGAASAAATNLVLAGGTLRYAGTNCSLNRGFTLLAGTTNTLEITDPDATLTLTTTASAATAGALTKAGPGKLTLGIGETWTGLTTISAGTLEYAVQNALSSGPVTVNGGTLDIKGFSDTVGSVTLFAGSIAGTTGVLTGASYMMTNAADASVSAILAGTGPLVKAGAGALTLGATNTYTGATTVNGGTLNVTGALAAGSAVAVGGAAAAGSPTLAGNGTVNGAVSVRAAAGGAAGRIAPGNAGPGRLTTGALTLEPAVFLDYDLDAPGLPWAAGNNDGLNVNGNLTLSSNLTFSVTPGAALGAGKYHLIRYTGALADNSLSFRGWALSVPGYTAAFSIDADNKYIDVTLALVPPLTWDNNAGAGDNPHDGSGDWDTAASNWWTGATNTTWNNSIPDRAIIGAGGTAGTITLATSITARAITFAAVDGNYTLVSNTLTLAAGASITVDDDAAAIGAVIAGSAWTKAGAGTLTLNGANTYTGATAISNGTLLVHGSLGGTGQVTAAGGTLGGTGVVAGTVMIAAGGALAPGTNAAGALTLNSGLTFDGGTFQVGVASTNAGGYGQAKVAGGNVQINSGSILDVTGSGYTPAGNDRLWIVNNSGPGTNSGAFLGLPEGATTNIAGVNFTIYYQADVAAGGTNGGNDVLLANITAKADQAITNFTPTNGAAFLTTNAVPLFAQASSGLPVTNFTVIAGPGVLAGLTNLTFTNAGTVSVAADQPGNDNWNAAPTVTNTYFVTKAVAAVTLTNLNQIYDGSARVVGATTAPTGLTVAITYDGNGWAPTNAGTYAVTGVVVDAMYQGATNGTLVVSPGTTNSYVSLNGGHVAPFTNWATAATNLADAVAVTINGGHVWVSNGLFTLTNQIVVAKGITIAGMYGHAVTLINGNHPQTTNRCFHLSHPDAVLDGLTITNGMAQGAAAPDNAGGGVYIDAGGTLQNCSIRGNRATDGGGVYGNQSGALRNCMLSGNTATNRGGGVFFCQTGLVENCTIAGNAALTNTGGGMHADASAHVSLQNAVVYANTAAAAGSNFSLGIGAVLAATSCCTAPTNGLAGDGILTSDPCFANPAASSYRLAGGSPCINTGTNQAWMSGALDLAGKRRIRYDRVDMGAYEWYPNLKINGIPAGDWTTINGVVPKNVLGVIP